MLLCHQNTHHQSDEYMPTTTNIHVLVVETTIVQFDASTNSITNHYHYGEEYIETQVYAGFLMQSKSYKKTPYQSREISHESRKRVLHVSN